MPQVLKSRKFWFSYAIPVAISTVAVFLQVITPAQYIAAITAQTIAFGGMVAWEDGQEKKALGAAGATPDQIKSA